MNGKPHRLHSEQAHKLSARVSPIAAPAVTGGEKVAANGAKENARWITFVRALNAASGRGRRIADFYRDLTVAIFSHELRVYRYIEMEFAFARSFSCYANACVFYDR